MDKIKNSNYYFVVFNKNNEKTYEKGTRPSFLNNFIQNIDFYKNLEFSTKVRDKIVEYEIRGPEIYLSVASKPILKDILSVFDCRNKCFIDKTKSSNGIGSELDYSSKSGSLSSLASKITSTVSSWKKRAFMLFSGKIEVKKLEKLMHDHLIGKNVDPEYANALSRNVVAYLKEENIEMISEIEFREKMKSVLVKMLPFIDQKELLGKIKNSKKPYSICFVGVNGVGKSTTLAKVTNFILKNSLSVFIAACDTFR